MLKKCAEIERACYYPEWLRLAVLLERSTAGAAMKKGKLPTNPDQQVSRWHNVLWEGWHALSGCGLVCDVMLGRKSGRISREAAVWGRNMLANGL